jgi:hypothetical protein
MNVEAWRRRLEEHRGKGDHIKAARRTLAALIVLVAIVVIIRVVLDPLATHFTRKAIDGLDGYQGDFKRVHVTIFSPGYTITNVKLWEHPGGSAKEPLIFAERVHVGADWRRLLHGHLAASVRVEHPKVSVVSREQAKEKKEEVKKKVARAPDLTRQLKKAAGMEVDRIEVIGGELLFRDSGAPREPEMWVHKLDLAIENIATRPELSGGRPVVLTGHGRLGKTGDLTLFVSADPFTRPLSFAGRVEEKGLHLAELYDLVEPKTKLQTPSGTADMFIEFVSKAGNITGGVKPVLKDVEVRPTEDGLGNKLKAWAADKAVEIASDRVPGRNAVSTVVPIKGRLMDPDVQLWPAVLGVIRNAFVEGLSSGFTHLPPDTSNKKQGVLDQAKNALDEDKGPPKAQPAGGEQKQEKK